MDENESNLSWDEPDEEAKMISVMPMSSNIVTSTVFKPLRMLDSEPVAFCQYNDGDNEEDSDDVITISIPIKKTRTRRDPYDVALTKRLATCGTYRKHFSLEQGIYVSYQVRCLRKDCPQCAELLGFFLKRRVVWCSRDEEPLERQQQDIYAFELPHDVTTTLRRRLGRANYINVPQENDVDVMFIDINAVNDGIALVEQYHGKPVDDTSYRWSELQRTPCGMNISGQLNRYVRDTSMMSEDIVIVPQITIVDAHDTNVDALGMQAALETISELPENFGQLQASIAIRSNKLLDLLDQNQVAYTVTYIKRHYRTTELDWKAGIAYLFNQVIGARYNELRGSVRELLGYAKKHVVQIQEIFGETYNKYFPRYELAYSSE